LQKGVPNMGKSHVTLVNIAFDLHHFLILLEIPSKSYCKMSNEKPFINYNRKIMMTSEHYLATFEQKLGKKEAIIQEQNV
jgi:hypothetical protein